MTARTIPPEDKLWSFAVRLYGRPGVAAACLGLQEDHAIDVPLLLFAAWAGSERALTTIQAEQASRAVSPWHTEIVFPLRALRQRLKSGPQPAPSAASDRLREAIKASELDSERLELAQLAAICADWPRSTPGVGASLLAMFEAQARNRPDAPAAAHLAVIEVEAEAVRCAA